MKKLALWCMVALMPLALAGCGECKHEYDDGVAAKEATCAEAGEKNFICTRIRHKTVILHELSAG